MDLPLSVAVAALVHENKILLIKRVKGDYIGYWALPGGKVEKDEHLSQAAIREIIEESKIESEFKGHLGLVSEHLIKENKIDMHFMLHLCELEPKSIDFEEQEEGKLKWFDLDSIENHENNIIPSDYLMIQNMVKNKNGNYFDCVIEEIGDNHTLKKFE